MAGKLTTLTFAALFAAAHAATQQEVQGALQHIKDVALEGVPKERRFMLNAVLRQISVESSTSGGLDAASNATLGNVTVLLNAVLQNFMDGKVERDGMIQGYLNAITSCNTQYTATDTEYDNNVTQYNSDHNTCRTTESTLYNDEATKCALLTAEQDSIRQDGVPSHCNIVPADLDNADAFLVQVQAGQDSFLLMQQTIQSLSWNCSNATADLAAQRLICNNFQSDFETSFCAWRAHRTMMCTNRPSCYQNAVDLYEIYEQAIMPISDMNAMMVRIILHVLCVLDNLRFRDLYDTTLCPFMALNSTEIVAYTNTFPAAPAEVVCSTADVAIYPGHTDFRTTYYSAILGSTTPPEASANCTR